MALRRRHFSQDFKVQVVRELQAGKTLAQAAREHQVNAGTLIAWRKQLVQYGDQAFQGNGHPYTQEARIAELERMVGQLAMENALRKRALSRLQTQTCRAGGNGGARGRRS